MEKIQRDVAHNHRLVPGPELEEKALVLKQLGETLTELKGKPAPARVTLRGSLLCPNSSACLPSQLTPPPSQLTSQACRVRCGSCCV